MSALGPLGAFACGREERGANGEPILPGDDPLVCELTSADMLGPYYRLGAPERSVVAAPEEPGTRLVVGGRVIGPDCAPLEGALVEIWQADDSGAYDNESDAFRLRGGLHTDAEGNYAFATILPGYYPGRPRHIHYKITYGGRELVTQLYFEMDPTVPSSIDDARVIPLEDDGDALRGNFDVVLASLRR
jgi:catechol 1,2-dioxygenase